MKKLPIDKETLNNLYAQYYNDEISYDAFFERTFDIAWEPLGKYINSSFQRRYNQYDDIFHTELQKSFLHVMQHAKEKTIKPDKFIQYLAQAAFRSGINASRYIGVHFPMDMRAFASSDEEAMDLQSPYALMLDKELRGKILECLNEMPDSQRISFTKLAIGQQTIAEVEQENGFPEGSVKVSNMRARLKLQKKLGELGYSAHGRDRFP